MKWERDSCLGHGISKFLKERLLETADVYHCYVCNQCGLFAQRMLRKDNKAYPTKKDIYFCQACKNYTDISKIRIPYAFKLLIQELMAMNICPRIKLFWSTISFVVKRIKIETCIIKR